MFGTVINKQGLKVEFVSLNEDKTPQFYELQDGESIVENGWQIANSMNKPQWNGSEWIDTEPLEPIEPPIVPPTEQELINASILLENANQQISIQENTVTSANLLMEIAMLKGGI